MAMGQYYLFTNKEAKTPDDFKGQKMRGSASFNPFLKALGVVPVTDGCYEVYGALQSRVIDAQFQV